jgi:hypothetical protein
MRRAVSLETNAYAEAQRSPWTTASGIVLIASLATLLVLLLGNYAFYARYVYDTVRYPFEMDYGEGIVWWQMAGLGRAGGMYTDVHAYPYIVYHYPPVYHAVSFVAAAMWGDALAAGRAVSAACTLVLAGLMAIVVVQAAGRAAPPVARAVGAAVAALLPFGIRAVFEWSPLMRVDMMAVMLNVAGICLFLASRRRPWLFYVAGLVFVLATFTKQTMITGAAACFTVSALVRPALTLRVVALSVAAGLAGLAVLTVATDGQFLLHVFRYNANAYRLDLLIDLWGRIVVDHCYMLAAVAASIVALGWSFREVSRPFTIGGWKTYLRREPQAVAAAVVILYVGAGTLTSLSLGKVGAYYNHAIDWMVGWSLVIALAVTHLVRLSLTAETAAARMRATAAGVAVALVTVLQVYVGGARWTTVPDDDDRKAAQQVLGMIQRTPGPVWSADMVLPMKAGKDVIAEPAIVSDLSRQGLWDQGPFLARLRDHWFDLVVIRQWGVHLFTQEMQDAVEQSYPVVEQIGDYKVYRPVTTR